jgi:1-deoxy-D-xylulose-5-phosphate reductoisomerase
MRVPIAFALHYPERMPFPARRLELDKGVSLDFSAPDENTFPSIRLAREAGLKGDRSTCALNAANEVAVRAFLDGRLSFLGISQVVGTVTDQIEPGSFGTYGEVAAVDSRSRLMAESVCAELRHEVRSGD